MGGGIEEAEAWRPYPSLVAGEGVWWRRALVPTRGGGTGEGDAARGAKSGVASWASMACKLGRLVQWGGGFFSFSFLYFSFLFYFTLKYLGTF